MNGRLDNELKARESLAAVGDAGVRLGFWTISYNGPAVCRNHLGVVDPEGRSFTLRVELPWNAGARITASVAGHTDGDTLNIWPRDALAYNEAVVEASCAASRDPETIAKDLHRRVTGSDVGRRQAQKVLEVFRTRLEQKNALLGHLETVARLGFQTGSGRPSSTHRADAWKPGLPRLAVHSDGRVEFERVSVPMDKLPALLALLEDPA